MSIIVTERLLLRLIEIATDQNAKALLLQSYIAEYGPLSEEAGVEVRRLLKGTPDE